MPQAMGSHMAGMGNGAWLWMILGAIIWLLLIAGAVALGVWTVQRYMAPKGSGPETASDILKKRYALGEITREEFEERKRDIA